VWGYIVNVTNSGRIDGAAVTVGNKTVVTGRASGATGEQFAHYLMATLGDKDLDGRWKAHRASD
jgi:hypothetical protein